MQTISSLKYAQALGAYSERENPLSMIRNAKDNEYTLWRMFGDVHLSVTPFKNFTLRTTLGLDYTQKEQRFFMYPIANGKVALDALDVERHCYL